MLRDLLRRPPTLPDLALEAAMAAAIEASRVRHALVHDEAWTPARALKLLLVGYVGTRNTGADVRVAEMLRQLRAIFGDEQLELTVVTSDARLSAGYFPGVRQVKLPDLFPPFLYQETLRHDGVVACEGSMFKSTFANALTTVMTGALGMAVSQNKVAVGYGAEAGDMDPALRALVARYCKGALVVVRNEPSRDVLDALGVRTAPGTDTAWTFEPEPAEPAATLLARAGASADRPLLVACPINPFWWPVRPAVGQALLDRLSGQRADTHYRSMYYHDYGAQDRARFEAYLDQLAEGVARFARGRAAQVPQVVVVGMERLDRTACDGLAARLGDALGARPPVLVSDDHDMHALVSVLREARWLVSSRYHAIVCSTSAGVPALGVTMDERIANLLEERGQEDLVLRVDDPDLGAQVADGLVRLDAEHARRASEARGSLTRQLEAMGRMGMALEAHVRERYPALPSRHGGRDWRAYLPPLSPALQALSRA
jgi:polysaccharide pyruvyl transferase WcaK-like protein